MNRDPHNEEPGDDAPVPARLAEGLAALHNQRVFVPPSVDKAILAHAREHLGQACPGRAIRQSPRRRALVPWLAAAAAVVVAAWLSYPLLQTRSARPVARAPADVNGDGRVDVLDAFALARQIERREGRPPDLSFDLDSDGRVDRQDVRAAAVAAVKLETGI